MSSGSIRPILLAFAMVCGEGPVAVEAHRMITWGPYRRKGARAQALVKAYSGTETSSLPSHSLPWGKRPLSGTKG